VLDRKGSLERVLVGNERMETESCTRLGGRDLYADGRGESRRADRGRRCDCMRRGYAESGRERAGVVV